MIYKNALLDGKIVDIRTEDGKFAEIGKISGDGVNLHGYSVYPGLVDIHSHGCIGKDTMDGKYLCEISQYLAKQGITSWLPTTMTMDMDTVKNVVNIEIPKTGGANILGFHMEGPYIAMSRKGAQNGKFIKAPDLKEFKELKNIKIVTIAPELDGAYEFIENCGCITAIGHTDADYECSIKAMECGANCLTHTFNAMPPLNHRSPGPVGAAIDKDAYVQVICDGLHIHKSVIKMLYRTFGAERMVLISDSMRATGMGDGIYEFGGQQITVKDSVARTSDGAVAGSTSTLMDCVKKAVEFGIPKKDAFRMASRTPSELLKVNKGRIKVGYDADFIAVDNKLNVKLCVINGENI